MNKFMTMVAGVIFAFIVWMIYLANTGDNNALFAFVRTVPFGDKLGHFSLFGVLTLALILATRFHIIRFARLKIYSAVVLVSLFVVAEEFSQAFIPSRTFDLADLAADSLGILLAIALAVAIRYFKPDQFNSRSS